MATDFSGGGTFGRMIGAESGGQQFGSDGSPLTSPAGAKGVAQIMPSTAPEAAQYAGVPFDQDRYLQDPVYNRMLGKAYYDHQVQQFGGDQQMAAAAYNAGPGAVQRAVAQSQQQGGSYLDYLPQETQAYVAKVAPDGGGAPTQTTAYAPQQAGPTPGSGMAAIQASGGPASQTQSPAAGVTNAQLSPARSPTDSAPGVGGAAVSSSLFGSSYPGQGDSSSMSTLGTQVAANTPQGGTLPFVDGSGAATAPASNSRPSPSPADLLAVMTNPWATPQQQQIAGAMYQQSLQRGRFTQYRDADGSLMSRDNLTNEVKVLQDNHPKSPDIEGYRAARQTGFQGSFDDYILGVKKATAPLTTTNIDQRGESAESAKSGEFAATRRNDMLIAADKAPENISRLQLMNKVLSDTQTGPLAGEKGKAIAIAGALGISPDTVKSWGLDPNQPVNNEIAQKLSNELVAGSIGAKGGGFPASNFSVAERQFIEKMFPNIASQPGSNQAVSDVLIAREQRNLDKADAWGAYKAQQRQTGKPLSYEDFEGNWQQAHGGDNIFAPIMQKYASGGYGSNGAPLPSPTPYGTPRSQNSGQSIAPRQGGSSPAPNARQAPDGHWYTPDPNRPGKYLLVQ